MNLILNNYFLKWQQIPKAVKLFLLKGILLLIVWKVLYLALLLPGRTIDAPLTNIVGKITASGLNFITRTQNYWSKNELAKDRDADFNLIWVQQQSVYFNHNKLVGIYDGCNALELFVLYAGFIICMPGSLKRKLFYVGIGTLIIFAVNILRCVGIAYIIQYFPKQADFAHHFVFVFIVYAVIIVLWLLFTRTQNNEPVKIQ